MKFKNLTITNFRAVELVKMEALGDLVLIAGQNGVGKSCIFDSIRLLKSSYGSYNQNEVHNWYDEFQLRIGNQFKTEKIFRDKNQPLTISATISLSKSEIDFLKENGRLLIERLLWRSYTKISNYDPMEELSSSLASDQRMYAEKIKKETDKHIQEFNKKIEINEFFASIELLPNNMQAIENNIILEVIFNTFNPEELGIIDYHGAHRSYNKENLQNINLNFDPTNNQYQQHALYNYTNKYNNVKTEMASSYIKALIARESGEVNQEPITNLNNSLGSLFAKFFPGKKFKGMVPTKAGFLEFPVELKTGEIHDISELSSGEKEVLFGYLRLRNQAPRNSVILIDEPELHLNPKLAKKLPEFYYETIGKELNNQIWLVTHSDAILKEVVGNTNYSIYHMSESANDGKNQLRKISLETEAEAALIDLIGEFSSYDQANKIVIFEGQDSEFDKNMTNNLFPEFENSVNSISAGSKTNVSNLQNVLKAASEEGIISKKFISIVDKDSDKIIKDIETLEFSWDVYHIENYLLNEKYILKVLNDLGLVTKQCDTEKKILETLKECADETLKFHIQHELNQFVTAELIASVKTKINKSNSLSKEYFETVENTIQEIKSKKDFILSEKELFKKEKLISNKFKNSLKNDSWKEVFNGRNILNRFTGKIVNGIRYEQFRNLIIAKMKSENYQPDEMKKVIEQILAIT